MAGEPMSASYRDISFTVTSTEDDKGKVQFTVTPSGLSESNEPITMEASGRVVAILADDIDGDDSPEVAVITEAGPDPAREAHVFTTFAKKSLGQVNFPRVKEPGAFTHYKGGDEYQFVENTFIRRFPLYENGSPNGKTRQLQFKLKPGEAMKQLMLDRTVEY